MIILHQSFKLRTPAWLENQDLNFRLLQELEHWLLEPVRNTREYETDPVSQVQTVCVGGGHVRYLWVDMPLNAIAQMENFISL